MARGVFVQGFLSGGLCPGGFCPGGFCPDTHLSVKNPYRTAVGNFKNLREHSTEQFCNFGVLQRKICWVEECYF